MQQPIWISRKRTLGLAFIAAGILGAVGIVILDVVRTSDQHGVGPAQKIALAGCVAIALLGISLILLGIDPGSSTVAVSWPASASNFVLQQNTNSPSSINWSNITSGIQNDGTNKSLVVNPASGTRFYRLVIP